jgi:hypothetical protein
MQFSDLKTWPAELVEGLLTVHRAIETATVREAKRAAEVESSFEPPEEF